MMIRFAVVPDVEAGEPTRTITAWRFDLDALRTLFGEQHRGVGPAMSRAPFHAVVDMLAQGVGWGPVSDGGSLVSPSDRSSWSVLVCRLAGHRAQLPARYTAAGVRYPSA